MSESQFPYLFSPLNVGPMALRNRIVNTPHLLGYAVDDCPSERHAYYYAERARGGAGLIVTESSYVHPTSRSLANVIMGYDPKVIPGYRRIAEMCHEHGARVVGQISHRGRQMTGFFSKLPVWAPSPIPCPLNRELPVEMGPREIDEVVDGFIRTTTNIQAAGYDGVEIHAGHGYLVHEFLSPWSNQRTDEYGGSLENRMRLLSRVIDAVRRTCGDGFSVGLRISGDELTPGGLTLDDMVEICRLVEATGKIDYISVSVGNYTNWGLMLGDMSVPLGAIVYMAAAIKEAVALPVITVLRIKDPVQAEKILADGQADLIGMTRALIADPELPNKAKSGRLGEIRECLGCLQECRRTARGGRVGCVVNPAAGEERELGIGTLPTVARKKKVVVVGGGPAGMEAARVAATRGHQVTLFEAQPVLGGQVNVAVKAPTREELGGVTRFLTTQMKALGVTVRLGVEATAPTVLAEQPDAVVIATGSAPATPSLPGAGRVEVVSVWDVLLGNVEAGQRVVVVDGGEGFWQCCSTAEFLAQQGKHVEVVTPLLHVGLQIPTESLPMLYSRLLARDVVFLPTTRLKAIRDDAVVCENTFSRKESIIRNVATVVMAVTNRPRNELAGALQDRVPELYTIGDCVAPRRLQHAIREGHVAGRTI